MLLIPVPMLSQWRRVRDPGGRTSRRWISELLGDPREQECTNCPSTVWHHRQNSEHSLAEEAQEGLLLGTGMDLRASTKGFEPSIRCF